MTPGIIRLIFSAWFFAHGIAHIPAFLVSWQLWRTASMPFHTKILNDRIEVGSGGVRLIGTAWLICGLAFIALAFLTAAGLGGWQRVAWTVLGVSIGLCALSWPRSWVGLVSGVVVMVLLALSDRLGLV
jgi:hypothetical protein